MPHFTLPPRKYLCAIFRISAYFLVCLNSLGGLSAGRAQEVINDGSFRFQPGLYGMPGLIDMPSAEAFSDGALTLSYAQFGSTQRATLAFQMSPRLTGAFRYAIINDLDGPGRDRFDRSFDLHYQLLQEGGYLPSVAIGLRDIGGTGIYSSEYITATKSFDDLSATIGFGWGRLAGRNPFDNPFAFVNPDLNQRPGALGGAAGEFDANSWFRGPASIFGGLRYTLTDRTNVVLEYSSDLYTFEQKFGGQERPQSVVNLGVTHRLGRDAIFGAYILNGIDIGLMLSYGLDPYSPVPIAASPVLIPALPQQRGVAGDWGEGGQMHTGQNLEQDLAQVLAELGLRLQGISVAGPVMSVTVENVSWLNPVDARDQLTSVLAQVAPPEIEILDIAIVRYGIVLRQFRGERIGARSFAWQSYEDPQLGIDNITAPRFSARISPYLSVALFDPDAPIRYEIGVQAAGQYALRDNLFATSVLRYPLWSTIDDAARRSNSVLPQVRSQGFEYAAQSSLQLNRLSLDYYFRAGPDLFGRISGGYLEAMFAGLSAELLWAPVDHNFALGIEVNHVAQRDFDMGFGLQDYRISSGHLSGYFDLGQGYEGQVDLGRYLAGDWGGTVTVARRFESGIRVGAFATLTDVGFERFGEGSFDKGIFVEIPHQFFTGEPSRALATRVIRPVQRDGGARLELPNRLYGLTRDYRTQGRFSSWDEF